MIPSFPPGIIIIGWTYARPKPGQVVIIKHEGLEKVKRVTKRDGSQIYVVGDNPDASTDSRNFGWLPVSVIVAKVIWPR